MMDLKKYKNVHCIGIGGIGLSGIAEILLSRGYRVTGSDMKASDITEKLERMGATVYIGHKASNVEEAELIIYSAAIAEENPEILAALQLIKDGALSPGDPLRYEQILRSLLDYNDYYMLLADLGSYAETQERVDATYRDPEKWNRMSLVNIARSGLFSSDRAVAEYARNIWHVAPVMFG